ncbi:uncharacterized protein LOC113797511 isoform X2 [Dermatophagoides pteronyssinus]|uniref:uncharacterized protein LOC113797511 isoform X2 n=1 Tax=Dermatophagoides pteronyssinus TaxID=6956 RepID=UPI003F666C8D
MKRMEKFKIPDIPKISPIISDKILSSSSMERKPKPKQQQQQQQKRQQQPESTTTTTANKEIIIEKKLCPSCSRLLMTNTIMHIQKCLTNLLNIIDNDIINEYCMDDKKKKNFTKHSSMIDHHFENKKNNIEKVFINNNVQSSSHIIKSNNDDDDDDGKKNVAKFCCQQQENLSSICHQQQNYDKQTKIVLPEANESRHQQSNPLVWNNESISDENNFGHPHQQQHEQQQQIDNQHQINHHQQQQQQQQRQQKIIVDKNTIFQTPLSTTELSTEMMMKNSSNSYFQENYNAVVDVDVDNEEILENLNKNIMNNDDDDDNGDVNVLNKTSDRLKNLNTEFGSSGDDVRALAASASASDSINVIIDKNDCPYAYVTIITNNLQAINSIIMANSLYYYNNHNLIIHHQQNDNNKQIKHYYRIPLIIFIQNDDDHHKIDLEIIQLIRRFFDHVIELKSNDLTLLNNKSLGINHQKVHLWKYLSEEKIYTKCIYLESNLLIVGNISNLFIDYMELSACVDCFFIDYFNCSMFVFEPNKQTYRQLIHFGSKSSSSSSCSISNSVVNNNDNLDGNHNLDDEPMDEITLLNEFFHSKWKRLSFIYNYLRNDLSYTQQSAYLRFGENIRIVNFGNYRQTTTTTNNTNQQQQQQNDKIFSLQPWDYKFNLNYASLMINNNNNSNNNANNNPFENDPIDDYSKFYLLIFIRRIWPLISMKLTPLMLEMEQQQQQRQQQNPKKWSVREIITMFQSRFDDRIQSPSSSTLTLSSPLSNYRNNFDQNSFSLRRLSTTTTMNNNRFLYDNSNNNNDDDRQQFKRNQKNQMSKESEKSLNHVSIVNNVTMTIDNSDSNNNDDDNQDEHVLNFDYEQSNQFEQQQEQRCLKNDHQDDVEEEIVTTKQIDYNMQNNSNNIGRKDEWENGQIDWLHQYQSDRIIDRLLTKF